MTGSGIYGKLPGHGDFIQRQLPNSFVTPWDEWLQRAVHGSQELLRDHWLDYYLTSPIWRFALSPGVLDKHAWAGVLVPSVDSVGRYFPLTFAAISAELKNPFAIQERAESWYRKLSALAVEGLEKCLQVDHLFERIAKLPLLEEAAPVNALGEGVIMAMSEIGISQSFSQILECLYLQQHQSFSLWWSAGSQYLRPTTLLSPGLPDPNLYCSMLGGLTSEISAAQEYAGFHG